MSIDKKNRSEEALKRIRAKKSEGKNELRAYDFSDVKDIKFKKGVSLWPEDNNLSESKDERPDSDVSDVKDIKFKKGVSLWPKDIDLSD